MPLRYAISQGITRVLSKVMKGRGTGLKQIVDLDVAGSIPVTRPNVSIA
jgi:hypothetical protein